MLFLLNLIAAVVMLALTGAVVHSVTNFAHLKSGVAIPSGNIEGALREDQSSGVTHVKIDKWAGWPKKC